MTKLVNRAKMTTATTGTGTITLGSAVDGYQTFAAAGVADADVVRYVIEDGDAWEIGLGTYSAGTLTRGSIESSNSDNALNLSGDAVVYVSAAAADLQELVDFADNFVLPTSDGSTGQVLQTNGAGTLSFTTISGYTDSDVDTHLNTSTASSGEVLSWTGSDYDWIAVSAGATDINGLSDGYSAGGSVGLGSGALANNDGAFRQNTAVGTDAGKATTNTGSSTFLGARSGEKANANRTTAIGYLAFGGFFFGPALTGASNTGVGVSAGQWSTTGINNVFVGDQAGSSNTTGSNNVHIGYQAGDANSIGSNQIVIGQGADASSDTVSNEITLGNTSITRFRIPGIQSGASDGDVLTYDATNGILSLQAASGGGAFTADGSNNLYAISTLAALTTGTDNFAAGNGAGNALTSGSNNVAIGNGALDAATTGGQNIAIGDEAMGGGNVTNQTAYNIAIGAEAGFSITTGTGNIAIGGFALAKCSGASDNLAIGSAALWGVAGSGLTGSHNTAVGPYAAYMTATTATRNVMVGSYSGKSLTTGANNTFVGYQAAGTNSNDITTGSNNILIGYNAQASSQTVSNEITLGNSSISTLRCQVTTITSLSDARDKTDIQPLNAGLEFVEALNPVSFTWNMRDGGKVGQADTGFIAQDLQAAQADTGVMIPGLVFDANPDKLEAGYGKLIPVLVQAIKDLSAEVKDLKAQLEAK